MNRKVLFVDDDANILASHTRQLHETVDLKTALSGPEALGLLPTEGPFAVVVADMNMPGMDGLQLLEKIRESSPDTARVMLTGNADLQVAIDAVNRGSVFRFLCKPCPPEHLVSVLEAGIEQYRLVQAEQRLLQETLAGTVKVLADLLALANPIAFGRAARVRDLMRKLAPKLGQNTTWVFEIAGILSQIGCLTLPASILSKVHQGKSLSVLEKKLFDAHPRIGQNLVAHIPRFEMVAEIIGGQEKRLDDNGRPLDSLPDSPIPLGVRAIHAVLDLDTLVRSGQIPEQALANMESTKERYDAQVLAALHEIAHEELAGDIREVAIEKLEPGMMLEEDVRDKTGKVLANTKGQEVTPSLKAWLKNVEPIHARVSVRERTK